MGHPPSLLALPPEIRNQIYELVLSEHNSTILCPFAFHCTPPSRPTTSYSLTQTCRQVRSETIHMWHASRILILALRHDNIPYYLAWLKRRPDVAFKAIRQVTLEDYQHAGKTASARHRYFCKSKIVINLGTGKPDLVSWRRDSRCRDCPEREGAVTRVRAVVGAKSGRGLTMETLEAILEAAAWNSEENGQANVDGDEVE